MVTVFIEKQLKMMSDGRKTHIVKTIKGRNQVVSTNIRKGKSVTTLKRHFERKGYEVVIV